MCRELLLTLYRSTQCVPSGVRIKTCWTGELCRCYVKEYHFYCFFNFMIYSEMFILFPSLWYLHLILIIILILLLLLLSLLTLHLLIMIILFNLFDYYFEFRSYSSLLLGCWFEWFISFMISWFVTLNECINPVSVLIVFISDVLSSCLKV